MGISFFTRILRLYFKKWIRKKTKQVNNVLAFPRKGTLVGERLKLDKINKTRLRALLKILSIDAIPFLLQQLFKSYKHRTRMFLSVTCLEKKIKWCQFSKRIDCL